MADEAGGMTDILMPDLRVSIGKDVSVFMRFIMCISEAWKNI
jgi:hypothetical protein